MKKLVAFHVTALVMFAGLGACTPPMPGPYGYATTAHPSDSPYNSHPSGVYKPRCGGAWDHCAYDAARNHTDGNPN